MKLSEIITTAKTRPLTSAWEKYYRELRTVNKDDSEHNDGYYHPSQICQCPALTFLMIEGFPVPREEWTPKGERIFNMGDSVHERIQVQLARAGVLETENFDVSMEVPIEVPDFKIRGHTDGILNYGPKVDTGRVISMFGKLVPVYHFPDPRTREILEIKSINLRGFEQIQKTNRPKPEHIYQASIYGWALGIEKITFLYECKDNQLWEEFSESVDNAAINDVQRVIQMVEIWRNEYRDTGKIPKEVYKKAKESAKDKKPWGIYAHDLLQKHLGEPTLEERHQEMLKQKSRLQRKTK